MPPAVSAGCQTSRMESRSSWTFFKRQLSSIEIRIIDLRRSFILADLWVGSEVILVLLLLQMLFVEPRPEGGGHD